MLDLDTLIYVVPAIIITVTLHELAHGWVSYKFGDPTPKLDGRLSLNPLHHLDPIGTIALLLVGFGWAKPVHIDPRYYKDAKTGIVWTAFAGPLMNFIIAFVAIFLFNLLLKVPVSIFSSEIMTRIFIYLIYLMQYTALISLGQAIFNMIPVPPLDGSKIIAGLLPDHIYEWFLRNEQLLSMLIFVLLFTNIINGPLLQLRNTIFNGMAEIAFGILF